MIFFVYSINVFLTLLVISSTFYCQDSLSSIVWEINRIDSLGGYYTNALNEFPTIIETQLGKAAFFNGINNGLLIQSNPIEQSFSFTIELVIRPDSSTNPQNFEQRYFHLRSKKDDNRRVMLELRLTPNQKWYLDTFIKSELSKNTLANPELTHPAGTWYHIALVYENGIMSHYVNGIKEATGKVNYLPVEDGQISIGVRQDPRSWFKGSILLIRFTKYALEPEKFINISFIK